MAAYVDGNTTSTGTVEFQSNMSSVVEVENVLRNRYGYQDWVPSLCAGPQCIGILGQCLVITSRPDMLHLELEGPGLTYKTLYANVSDIAQLGGSMFRLAKSNMFEIGASADMLAGPGGTVAAMLRFCQPDQDEGRDRQLKRLIQEGRAAVDVCTSNIKEIKNGFEAWHAKTNNLVHALEEMSARQAKETKGVENEISKNEASKKLQEEEQANEERRLKEHRARTDVVQTKKDWWDDNAAGFAAGVGIASEGAAGVLATAAAVGAGIVGTVGVAAAAGVTLIHYYSLNNELCRLEDQCAQRALSIKKITTESARLQDTLLKLSSEKSTLAQVIRVVRDSVEHVSALQAQILSFMEFIEIIETIMTSIGIHSKGVHGMADDHKDMVDQELKKLLWNRAFEMSAKLAFASRASKIFMEVSHRFIMPEVNRLPTVRFGCYTDSEVSKKLKLLDEKRQQVFLGTNDLVLKMQGSLKDDLKRIVETCASSVELIEDGASKHAC